jgi:hypothetical protein
MSEQSIGSEQFICALNNIKRLQNGELHNFHSTPDTIRQIKSRRMRWAGHVARMGEGRNLYRVLVGKFEGKRPLERPRIRWEDGKEIGWGMCSGFTWFRIRDRWRALMNAVMNFGSWRHGFRYILPKS